MTCRGCGKEKDLIDAHIIPKSFYMNLRADSNHLDVFHNAYPDRKMRSFKGEYDQELLCKECDSVFEKSDDYAKKLLIDRFSSFKELHRSGELIGWDMGRIDYKTLKHFFLSVLWRASITSRPFFKRVTLGPHESIIKSIIWGNEVDKNNTYTIVLSKFVPKKDSSIEQTIMDPDWLKMNGLNYYRIYFAGYTAWIKVDKRKPEEIFERLELSDKQTIVVARDFDTSKEQNILSKSVTEYLRHNK